MDLKHRLDEELAGHAWTQDTEVYVKEGQRALRRRRMGAAAVSVAAVGGAVALTGALVGGGPADEATMQPADNSTQPQPATTSTAGNEPAPSTAPILTTDPNAPTITTVPVGTCGMPHVCYSESGDVVQIEEGWRDFDLISEPLENGESVALEIWRGGINGEKLWVLAGQRDGENFDTWDQVGEEYGSLQEWTAAQMPGTDDGELVRHRMGELVPVDKTVIIEQVVDVDLGPDFANPGEATFLAKVRDADGKLWFVLVHEHGQYGDPYPPDYYPVAAAVAGPTMDDAIAYFRQQVESGEVPR